LGTTAGSSGEASFFEGMGKRKKLKIRRKEFDVGSEVPIIGHESSSARVGLAYQ